MRVGKGVVKSVNPLVCLLSVSGLICACVSPGAGSGSAAGSADNADRRLMQVPGKRMTPQLQKQFGALEASPFVPVIIRLSGRPDLRAVSGITGEAQKSRRRAAIISHLRQNSLETQSNILNSLTELETAGFVVNVRPLWIVNAISAEVTAEAIDSLSRLSDIEYITSDTAAPLFLAETPWNINRINSPDVWSQASGGHTGEGVVVAVLDSGTDLDHPDLIHNFWINPAEDLDGNGRLTRSDNNGVDDDGNGLIDDVVGWDFESSDNDPSPNLFESGRAQGHGTHVAGIIAGDGTNGISTGVAPGASLMILKISSQSSAWAAMQYALANGADIVNMSLGWTNSSSPDLASWRDAVEALADAGVLLVTSAGSGGQAPLTHASAPADITTPGRVPRALTVGAVAAPADSAWLDPVAPFSSGGPTSWQSVSNFNDYPFPPGLLKPDITAPGVAIVSTMIGGSYQAKSGTSVATAHVSGGAALLLEQDADLLPHELLFLLRENAWRVVAPNNVRGWGRLDVLKAINHDYDASSYDLAINDANALWITDNIWIDNDNDGRPDEPVAGMTNRVYARIKNHGEQAVGNVEIKFHYTNAGTISSDGLGADDSRIREKSVFRAIGSYFVPVIGPAGSSQDTAVGTVEWLVPQSDNDTDHWSLGVEVVASNPPNAMEKNRNNNVAIRNHFKLSMSPGEILTFRFFIHGDPHNPSLPFDLELVRRGLPRDFEIELSLDNIRTDKWVERMRGFEPVSPVELADFPGDVTDYVSKSVTLLGDRGHLERIALTDSRPLPARIVIRAPDIDGREYAYADSQDQYIVVNTANNSGIFGGLALGISVNPDAAKIRKIIYTEK